jgi:transposase
VPDERAEAARDLTRCREQLRADLARARHRASKLLLRHGRVYATQGSTWTKAHWRWLQQQRFDQPETELALLDYLTAIEALLARRALLEERLSRLASEPQWWPTVARLRCFRGVETLTALALRLEVGEWRRFARPAELASYLGLVPSLDQSGESATRGAITKTGCDLERRQQGQPPHVLQIAWRAQRRLYRLYRTLRARGKPRNVATVAAARELACFLWAAAVAT